MGVREVDDQVWQVSFVDYDLGFFDKDEDRVEPGINPFTPAKVLIMCSEYGVKNVTGMHLETMTRPEILEHPTTWF